MEGGEDKEENNTGESAQKPPVDDSAASEAPVDDSATSEAPVDDSATSEAPVGVSAVLEAPVDDSATSEAPAAESPPSKTPTSPKTPSRSITPLSKIMEESDPSKTASSTVKVAEKADISQESVRAKIQSGTTVKSGIGPIRTVSVFPAALGEYGSGGLFKKRSPFIHDPPQPEERRTRFSHPRTPREYIINLRENLADFQESHGLPRTRDYSFLSLGLALAQETARAIYSVLLMFAELFPILAIVSLILRFALDKLIEILETAGLVPKIKKTIIFFVEMVVILIPLWILIGSIVIPLISLIFSMFARMLRLKKGRKICGAKAAKVVPTQLPESEQPNSSC